jgi:hypothetical protein
LVLGAGWAGTGPAAATEYVTGEWGVYQGMSTFWGNMDVDGTYGLCVDPGAEPPDSLDKAHATRVCGTVVGSVPDRAAQTAWLLGRHLHDTDTETMVSLSQFVRAGYHSGVPVTYPARHAELVAEAAHAGPKDAYVEVDLAAGKIWFGLVRAGEAAQIMAGALPRESAHHTPGFTAALTITSPNASFVGGAQTITATTGVKPVAAQLATSHHLIKGEQVSANVAVEDVPEICYTLYEEGSYQRVATPLASRVANGVGSATQALTVWAPVLTTVVTKTVVKPGGTVVDRVQADALGGSQWPVKQWADEAQTEPGAYYPFTAAGQLVYSPTPPAAASQTLPAGSKVLEGKTTATLTGPGVPATASVQLPADAGSGFYSLRWCLDQADQGASAGFLPDGGPFCDDYHAATERFTVPMRLALSTAVPDSVVAKGDAADDTVTLFLPEAADQWIPGLDGEAVTVKVHGTLYGASKPFVEQADPPAHATPLGQADVAVTLPTSGREPVTVAAPAGFDVSGATHWTWVWEVRRADQTAAVADLIAADAADSFGDPTESGHTPMTLAIGTAVPDQHSAKGQAPDDTVTVSLPDPDDQWIARADGQPATLKARGVFYAGSTSSFTVLEEAPEDALELGSATVDITLPTSGRAPVTVPAPAGFTVPTSQYGTWVWEIRRADQAAEVAELFDNEPRDRFGQRQETHVTQMDLAIRSQVERASLPEPTGDGRVEVCDRVWLEHTSAADLWLNQWGTDEPVRVVVDGALHHAAVPGPEQVADAVPVTARWSLTFAGVGEANAQVVCHPVAYGEYGAYGFTWRIDLMRQPAATQGFLSRGTATPLWLPEETAIVRRTPVVRTAATMWTATAGGAEEIFLTDEIWQVDWPDGPAESDHFGAVEHGSWPGLGPWAADGQTIRVELWRIEGEVTAASCDASNPAARLVAVNESTPAANTWAGALRVSGSRFKAEGGDASYTFVVSWPGDARTEPYRSVCGEASETIKVNRQAPEFSTRLLPAGEAGSAPAAPGLVEVQPGEELTDVLSVVFPDEGARQADLTGWSATWEFHHQVTDGAAPAIVRDALGQGVYEGATCVPETLFAVVSEPAPVEAAGEHASQSVAAPAAPGMVYAVETVRDADGAVVRRGTCGAVAESALVAGPEAAPQIVTAAPARATVGVSVQDLARLTGPFPEGTVVEFWYQATAFVDPTASDLSCAAPDPDSMAGAVWIGQVVLDHAIAAGEVEELLSPPFTVAEPGCTWIKEIAHQPGSGPIVEGRFDVVAERTIWSPAPPRLALTGAETRGPVVAGAAAVGLGAGLLALARRRGAHPTA